jgi:diaminohydroxyphosphoribosylaminopyrimidine deaminase/5-amino-6-(5-phosphoribosylamino)uracil reductase
VGAVVVRDGAVIATGATEPPPGRHAEAVALDAAGPLAAGAELYVTLEPCVAFPGKRTPPCSQRIVDAGITRVHVALADPDAAIEGAGLQSLRAAGLDVIVGDGEDDVAALLRPYIKHRRTGLPYAIAKFAASLDGRTATASGNSRWITGEAARDLAHQQRAWVDAVMAGSGTILADDPSLTARPGGVTAARQPARVIVDGRGRVPPTARLLGEPGVTIVATAADSTPEWRASIAAAGAQVIACERDDEGVNLEQLFGVLGSRGVISVWAEGGATLLGSLFDHDLVDEVWAFLAPVILGGRDAVPAVAGRGAALVADGWRLHGTVVETVGEDVLVRGYTRANP